MTDDERAMLMRISTKVDDLNEFFMEPRENEGKLSRAVLISQILDAATPEEHRALFATLRSGKMAARAILYIAAVVTTLTAAWAAVKGFGK